ncbi:hypothetical protein SASPL_129926 [Salvia splendens]|uniref:Uncharacterized protein n=1 Tax=Salvia splendens TaxID=180675 RepID=A0A8X8ZNE9_SALSN|nr:hypothetical protein SASPL_129926 [Salvia splendens]
MSYRRPPGQVRETGCHTAAPRFVSTMSVGTVSSGACLGSFVCAPLSEMPCITGCEVEATFLGIAYVVAREWRLACMGMSDPCLGSDGISSTPLQLSGRAFARPISLGSSRADVDEECYLVDPASSHMLVSKIKPCMFKKLVVGLWAGSAGPPHGVHRSSRPFCRRCAPGLNWPGRASGAVTLKKLECSKQAYALDTLAWDNIIGFRRTTAKAFAKNVFINQERKLGARRRSDTVLVSTINDADQGSADVAFRTPPAPYEKSKYLGSGGSMVARLKLKGIDGRAPPGVEPAA